MNKADLQLVKKDGLQRYGIIGRDIMRSKNISNSGKLLYSYFCSFIDSTQDYCFPLQATILEESGITTKKTLYKTMKELENLGILKKEKLYPDTNSSRKKYSLNHMEFKNE